MRLSSRPFLGASIVLLLLAGCEVGEPCPDADGDGHQAQACGGTDCDDENPAVYPGAVEICGNGLEDDCNPRTTDTQWCTCTDADGDGHVARWCGGDDCDDEDPEVYPGAEEICDNGRDEDCDGHDWTCACQDCSAPGLAFQGRDRDMDGWGECCDCDDYDPAVHPGQTEFYYNQKDDDCDPMTADGGGCPYPDRDCDGYADAGSPGGTDCNDRDATVHPGAAERCDGVDTDCDGSLAPDGCDDPPFGGCPRISGLYDVEFDFGGDTMEVPGADLAQVECDLGFSFGFGLCTGNIDDALTMQIQCPGLELQCSGRASLTAPFTLGCGEPCSVTFRPLATGAPCTAHQDPVCTANHRLCGVMGDEGTPVTLCVNTMPQGREPGYYCDESQGLFCDNSLCLGHACGAICADDADCAPFAGTACQTVAYDDGLGTQGDIRICAPTVDGETRCASTPDCAPGKVCTVRPEQEAVATICAGPNPAGEPVASACSTGEGAECLSGLCVCGDRLCDGLDGGFCSDTCDGGEDCPNWYTCAEVLVADLQGDLHPTPLCVPDPNACRRHADCPPGMSCQVSVTQDGLQITAECWYGPAPGIDNTGEPCLNDTHCFSAWCDSHNNFCQGLCVDDGDCPTYQASEPPPACASDDECGPEQLCQDSACVRPFECALAVFFMGFDDQGQKVYDSIDLCRPVRRPCQTDADCRAGESCQVSHDPAATESLFTCAPGGGAGQPGDDCYPDGDEACWSKLCLLVSDGGPGNQYCSAACTAPEDCGDPALWDCQPIPIDIRPGYVGTLPACVKRADRGLP